LIYDLEEYFDGKGYQNVYNFTHSRHYLKLILVGIQIYVSVDQHDSL